MFESGCFRRCRAEDKKVEYEQEKLDNDVLAEQKRVENNLHEKLAVKVDHLRMIYSENVVVKDV